MYACAIPTTTRAATCWTMSAALFTCTPVSTAPGRRQYQSSGTGTSRLATSSSNGMRLMNGGGPFPRNSRSPHRRGSRLLISGPGRGRRRTTCPTDSWPAKPIADASNTRRCRLTSLSRCPKGSRINYQVQVSRGHHIEQFNDPLNPKLSRSPFGTSSTCLASGYTTPEWTMPDHDGHAHSPIVDRYLSTENRRPCCPSPSTRPGSF
jgi:hypothetical protein